MSGLEEKPRKKDKREEDAASPLTLLRQLLGGLAGITAFVYLTGGLVLGLRLAFAQLPALGVVGQLPRDVLFSIGASQIVLPALGIATLHLVYRGTIGMQQFDERPGRWMNVAKFRVSRLRHLLFVACAPVLLLVPGTALALARTDLIPDAWPIALIAGTVTLYGAGLLFFTLWAKHKITVDPETDKKTDVKVPTAWIKKNKQPKLRLREVCLVAYGALPFVVIGVGACVKTDGDARFLLLPAAWLVCLACVLGYGFARAGIGEHFSTRGEEQVRPQLLLSLLVAAVVVPGLVAFWAGWPLPSATVCMTAKDKPAKLRFDGLLIGETSNRVYIGDPSGQHRAITSIPAANVARVVFGDEARPAVHCKRPA